MLAASGSAQRFRPNIFSTRLQFRPSVREDSADVASFLQRIFRVPPTSALVDERHIAWKYWWDRDDFHGPRSFTARHDTAIVAHVAAWPVRFRVPGRVLTGAHLIDWASDPKYPGAGMWLIRQIRAKSKLLIATGGTDITRRALPAVGFRPYGDIHYFARPLRPFGQARTTADTSWRRPARFVRNTLWRWLPSRAVPDGWSAAPIDPPDIDESVWAAPSDTCAVSVRDAAFYRYLLASPSTRHTLFGLRRRGELVGYFCLAYARHVARIADFWVRLPDVGDWRDGFRTACATAAQRKDMYEVTAWTSTALGRQALTQAGFRLRDLSTLSLFGDASALGGRELSVQMIECDASFLAADEVSYLT